MTTTQLQMRRDHYETMRLHVEACKPLEGCGLLLGVGAVVERVVPVLNAAKSPTRFLMEPAEQLHAFQEMEEQGLELLGIFHSHPPDRGGGVPVLEGPSETDVREAAYPVVNVIWSQGSAGWDAHGFWIEQGTFYEVPLVLRAGE